MRVVNTMNRFYSNVVHTVSRMDDWPRIGYDKIDSKKMIATVNIVA